MRLVTIKAPSGQGKSVADIAFAAGASRVSIRQARQYTSDHTETDLDVVEIDFNT
ncbi:hypothetical protein GCM10023188_04090 [Pontibacter saemangeumensis]|uniref:Uncharacterized protein n=1 Tax=Pontibacter saemangeumensis TaxID=1084525 RepID=A0ABP8L7L9_9BACT